MRLAKIVNPTVRFGAMFSCWEPYRAVSIYFLSYNAVQCGFPTSSNLRYAVVRFGFQERKTPTVRCNAKNKPDAFVLSKLNKTVPRCQGLKQDMRKISRSDSNKGRGILAEKEVSTYLAQF